MPAFPPLTSAKGALSLAFLASLALALPQSGSQGTDTPYTLSPNTSTASTASTHLSPSLIHSSLPTLDSKVQVKNDQREDTISTATIFSTIIVPTATDLTTILTVVTNTNAPHALASSLSTSTTTSPSSPSTSTSNCIVEGETTGICVTIVPIWLTNSLTQAQAQAAVKRQTTQTPSIPSYSSTFTSKASVTVIEMLTVIVAPHTTYTLTGFVPFSTTGTSSAPIPTPTATATGGPTTSVTCPSPSWLIDGHCVGNTPGWNPAPQNPTGMDGWDGRPRPPWETATTAV